MSNKIILVGSGYLGNYIINILLGNDLSYDIVELARTKKNRPDTVESIKIDLDSNNLELKSFNNGRIIYMAPPSIMSLKDERMGNFLKSLEIINIKQFIYISTSGVYGNCNGALVDESWKVNPSTDRAKRRVSAELQLTDYCNQRNINLIILRVPGIYGKGRLPIDRIKSGEPIIKKEESRVTNLLHVEDLARLVVAGLKMDNKHMCEIINVSDGNPVSSTDYYERISKILGIKISNYITYEEARVIYTEKRLSFMNESRVLNIDKMNKMLPGCVKYQSLDDGIRASLEL
jgi:nucleoside-diphosphate-sugar epimerase